jgi:hypothetical protein
VRRQRLRELSALLCEISSFSPPTATITLDDTSCAGLGLLGTIAAACWSAEPALGAATAGAVLADPGADLVAAARADAAIVACDALAAIGLHFTDVRPAVRLHAVEVQQAVLLHLIAQLAQERQRDANSAGAAAGANAQARARAAVGLLLEFALPAACAVLALAFRPGVAATRAVELALLKAASLGSASGSGSVAPHALRVLAFARSALGLPAAVLGATSAEVEAEAAAEAAAGIEAAATGAAASAAPGAEAAAEAATVSPGGGGSGSVPRELLCSRTVLACLRMLARVFISLLPALLVAGAGSEGGDSVARAWLPVATVFEANLRAIAACGQTQVLEAARLVQRELLAQAAQLAGPAWGGRL